MKIRNAFVALGSLLLMAGCAKTTLEVKNETKAPITVTVGDAGGGVKVSTRDRKGRRRQVSKPSAKSYEISPGATRSIPVSAPPLNDTAQVPFEIQGRFVQAKETLTVTVGQSNRKRVLPNR